MLRTPLDRAAHHKKVRQWLMNPGKFHSEIEATEKQYCGKCIYHLSKSHSIADCNIKKDCDKLLLDKKRSNTSNTFSSTSGYLHHIKEGVFEDAVYDVSSDEMSDPSSNDTDEAD
jgi:hypothetical protein